MDPRTFCAKTRLAIVAGKGGVGKTTVAAALARLAARHGLSALIVEIDGKASLASCFDAPPSPSPDQPLVGDAHGRDMTTGRADPELRPGEIWAHTLTADEALLEYLDSHGMRRLSRRLARTGAVDVIATAAPGIKDILLLGKVRQLERRRVADLVILDAPAAGHALTFLLSPRALLDTIDAGPVREQAEGVLEMLSDPSRTQALLVTLPEETPVNEAVEAAFALEDRVGVDLGPIIVNGLYPVIEDLHPGGPGGSGAAAAAAGVPLSDAEARALDAAAAFRAARQALQAGQLARLARALPLPQLHLPLIDTARIGLNEVDLLADALGAAVAGLQEVGPR